MSDSQSSHDSTAKSMASPLDHEVPFPRTWLLSQSPTAVNGESADRETGQGYGDAAVASETREYSVAPRPSPESSPMEQEEEEADNWVPIPSQAIPMPPSAQTAPMTTLLVRNISRRVQQEDALNHWSHHVWNFDLLYLIFDLNKNRPSGRAFINFLTQQSAMEFRDRWHDIVYLPLSGADQDGIEKPLIVENGERQGLQANIAHWYHKLRADVDLALLPAIFVEGRRVNFWAYSRTLFGDAPGASSSSSFQTLSL